MKILVYGAGNLGSLYAAKLKEGGHRDSRIKADYEQTREVESAR